MGAERIVSGQACFGAAGAVCVRGYLVEGRLCASWRIEGF